MHTQGVLYSYLFLGSLNKQADGQVSNDVFGVEDCIVGVVMWDMISLSQTSFPAVCVLSRSASSHLQVSCLEKRSLRAAWNYVFDRGFEARTVWIFVKHVWLGLTIPMS